MILGLIATSEPSLSTNFGVEIYVAGVIVGILVSLVIFGAFKAIKVFLRGISRIRIDPWIDG